MAKFLSADGPPVYQGIGLVRTVERGNELAASLGDGPVVLMRAHGDSVVGASIEQVIERTTRLAMLGEWNHLALLHGEPKYLTARRAGGLQCRPTFPHARLGILREPAQRPAVVSRNDRQSPPKHHHFQ